MELSLQIEYLKILDTHFSQQEFMLENNLNYLLVNRERQTKMINIKVAWICIRNNFAFCTVSVISFEVITITFRGIMYRIDPLIKTDSTRLHLTLETLNC